MSIQYRLIVSVLATCCCGLSLSCGGGGHSSSGVPAAVGAGEWGTVAPLQVSRQEVGVAALNSKVYVVAGTQNGTRISSVEVYDPATNTWRFAASLPPPALDHVGVAGVGGKLYAIGGFSDGGSVGTLFEYDPATDRWTRKADLPTVRGATGVGVINGKIYAAGGNANGTSVTDFARYDPATDHWEVLPPMPTPRDHLAAAVVGGLFHAIGGRRLVGGSGPNIGVHEVFDPAAGGWSTRAALPTPRSGMGAGTLIGRIQVFGGEGNPARSEGTFAENEEYNPLTDTWRALALMPVPRHGTQGAVVGDLLYVPGGGPIQGFSDTAEVDVFRYR